MSDPIYMVYSYSTRDHMTHMGFTRLKLSAIEWSFISAYLINAGIYSQQDLASRRLES